MFTDAMEDLDITLAVKKDLELRRDAEVNSDADPSLYSPWAIMGPMDYRRQPFKTTKPD